MGMLLEGPRQRYILAVTERGYGKRMAIDEFRTQGRGEKRENLNLIHLISF